MADVTKTGGNATRAIVIVGGLLIVALVGVIIALVMVLNRPAPVAEAPSTTPRATVITEENVDEVLDTLVQAPTAHIPESYEVQMNTVWHFPDGASPSTDAYVANAESNETPVYFDVALRDVEEPVILYQSPVLPLGSHLENITLDRDMDPGTYRCVLTYYLIDENQTPLTQVNMGLTIVVEN